MRLLKYFGLLKSKMHIRRVVGKSMAPTLKEGQIVVARHKKHTIGDVVIASVEGREVLKRVITTEPQISLEGDNINSAKYDDVNESDILGVVIWPKIKT